MNVLPALAWTLIVLLASGPSLPGERETVTLYLPHATELCLTAQTASLPDRDIQTLVDALAEENAIPNGVKVLNFTLDPTPVLDVSEEFELALATTGTAGERMMLYALVNTVLDAYELEEITLRCQGRVPETGHNLYTKPLGFDLDG